MTTMGLNYLVYEETKRSNLAKEGENFRSNQAREKENFRSAVAGLSETVRHNRMSENLGWGEIAVKERGVAENERSNKAREKETHRTNVAQEGQKSQELREKAYQFNVGNLSEERKAVRSSERLEEDTFYTLTEQFKGGVRDLQKWIPLIIK